MQMCIYVYGYLCEMQMCLYVYGYLREMHGTEDVACCHSQHGSVLVLRSVAGLVGVDVSGTGKLELPET